MQSEVHGTSEAPRESVTNLQAYRPNRQAEQERTSEQLKQDNAEIQQLLNEKSQLEKKLEETAQQETTQETQEISGAVLCFHSLDESFYTEIYPVVKEKVDSGILILEDGKLPGDNDYISAQAFSELIEDGWELHSITIAEICRRKK